LSKAKLFTKQKAFEVAAAITSQGEEVYLNKSRQLNDALRGAFNNINCYFPIEEVLRIVDTRGLLEKLNQENQPQQDEQKPTEEMSEGSSTPQSQDGQGYYQECSLTPTAGG
jgi:hypothetical protein